MRKLSLLFFVIALGVWIWQTNRQFTRQRDVYHELIDQTIKQPTDSLALKEQALTMQKKLETTATVLQQALTQSTRQDSAFVAPPNGVEADMERDTQALYSMVELIYNLYKDTKQAAAIRSDAIAALKAQNYAPEMGYLFTWADNKLIPVNHNPAHDDEGPALLQALRSTPVTEGFVSYTTLDGKQARAYLKKMPSLNLSVGLARAVPASTQGDITRYLNAAVAKGLLDSTLVLLDASANPPQLMGTNTGNKSITYLISNQYDARGNTLRGRVAMAERQDSWDQVFFTDRQNRSVAAWKLVGPAYLLTAESAPALATNTSQEELDSWDKAVKKHWLLGATLLGGWLLITLLLILLTPKPTKKPSKFGRFE